MQNFFNFDKPDTYIGMFAGCVGGFIKYTSGAMLLHIDVLKNVEAIVMAVCCGFAGVAGVAGKHLFSLIIKKIKNKKQ